MEVENTCFLFCYCFAVSRFAQTATGGLRGQITDPSGAVYLWGELIMTPALDLNCGFRECAGHVRVQVVAAGKYVLTSLAPDSIVRERQRCDCRSALSQRRDGN